MPATRVYGPGYYLLPARDINHGYPCGVSASTFCIKRNETQRNRCLRKGNSGIGNCAWLLVEKIGIRGRRNYIFRCLEPRKSVPYCMNLFLSHHQDLASTRNLIPIFFITFFLVIQTVVGILIKEDVCLRIEYWYKEKRKFDRFERNQSFNFESYYNE